MIASKLSRVFFRIIPLLLLVTSCGVFDASNTLEENAMSEQPSFNTSIPDLEQWFNLDQLDQPNSVMWRQITQGDTSSNLPGPTDYYVVAILEYSEDVEDLPSNLNLSTRADVYVDDSFLEDWMPNEILNSFNRSAEGYIKFDGIPHSSDGFLLPPLTYGYILFVDRYILLYGATI